MRQLNDASIAFLRGDLERARPSLDDRFEPDWLRDQLTCAAS